MPLGSAGHWGVSDPPADHAGCIALWESYARLHASKGSTGHTFYNWGFCNHGLVLRGRGWDRMSGANGTTYANLNFWAYCWLGGPGHVPTVAAYAALAGLIASAPNTPRDVRPHRVFYSTACPGPDITAWIEARGFDNAAPPLRLEDDMAYSVVDAIDGAAKPVGSYWRVSGNTRKKISASEMFRLAGLAPEARVPYLGFMPGDLLATYVDVDAVSGGGSGSGLTADQVSALVRKELDGTKLVKAVV